MSGYFSYLSAAAGFGFLSVLLLFSWRSSTPGKLLTIVAVVTTVWAVSASQLDPKSLMQSQGWLYPLMGALRYLAWFVFLLYLLKPVARNNSGYRRYLDRALPLSSGFVLLVLLIDPVARYLPGIETGSSMSTLQLTTRVILAIIGLLIVEQLFRNTTARHRWAVKYLFIAAGGLFAFDFYLYANALLFREIDPGLWVARGFVTLMAVPLLTLAAARNRDWSHNLFVSRDIVLYGTTVVGAGLYLLVMAAAGYYLRTSGGHWGQVVQVTFLTLAVVLLVAVLFSGRFRTLFRVFLGKHFYRNKYDYRHEWLQVTGKLNKSYDDVDRYESVISVIARLVDARAGQLWLRDDHYRYTNLAAWQTTRVDQVITAEDALVRFLDEKHYVINVPETATHPGEYEGLELPAWITSVEHCWLIVPLPGIKSLIGFMVLARPLIARDINWEDRDLLLTAARQVSSYLTVLLTTDALSEARQFEAFNRISSYMVHDLKNIAAELELIARNAERHRDNPEFIEDTLATVENSSQSIKRLLEQLRNRQITPEKKVTIDLGVLAGEVVDRCAGQQPVPQLQPLTQSCQVQAERERLANVLKHLIDNACQATGPDGKVTLAVYREAGGLPQCVIEITDDGHGMDAGFVQQRLFKPFDTTKGNAGMGIGMYESREFVRQCRGDIRVNSAPGQGTTIAVCLPARD